MSNAPEHQPQSGSQPGTQPSPGKAILQLPGLIAISLYMLILAGVITLGVVAGGHYPRIFLVFSVLFIAASAGLMRLLRWAWALALAAVVLLAAYYIWSFYSSHELPFLIQGLLNLVFFLYLVRAEVREKLV